MKGEAIELGKIHLTTHLLAKLASQPSPAIWVDPATWEKLEKYRAFIDKAAKGEKQVYGINTGFGFLANVKIPVEETEQLQVNLIRSHACGVGAILPPEQVRALLILKTHNFLQGHSGVTRTCVETMLTFIEKDILPIIPSKGSVGASGDLAPLSHLALGLMGEGDVTYLGKRRPTAEVLREVGVKPVVLQAKEGLALANGTQYMTSLGALIADRVRTLARAADAISALTLDALKGSLGAFDARIHQVRHQPGQRTVAANFAKIFEGKDEIMDSHIDCGKVQDPYSLRCIPQVHGACRDLLEFVEKTFDNELNSATDNPLVFENGEILSGGNFHGQPVAFALDIITLALCEIGSISERRIEKMTNPHMSGLPAFLTKKEGLNSGFMIPHVVAAALVSENKIHAHPASVDSIPTSADKEDHVSMGPIGAMKALTATENVAYILAIEALGASQGLDIHLPLKPSKHLQSLHKAIRQLSSHMDADRSLSVDIEETAKWILDRGVDSALADSGLLLQ